MANGVGLEATNVAGAITSMHIDELVSNLAIGIANGQMALDRACMEIAQFMGEAQIAFGKRAGSDEPDLLSLIELGFSPNFYQFVDTILEVRVSVSTQFEESREYDTSYTSMHQDEYQAQSQYESSRESAYGGKSSSSGSYGSWGWRWGWGWGGSRSGSYASESSYSGSSASRYASSSSYKQKNVSMTTVDAKYASTYNYAVEGSSLIKTKIVPIPPPQVYEEIIRAKLQQRREEEQRLRLLGQAESILTSVGNSTNSILSDEAGLKVEPFDFKQDNATRVQDSVQGLKEEYNQVTTEHWAVIEGSVQLREAADSALEKVSNGAQKLVDLFPDSDTQPDKGDIGALLDALTADLGAFKSKIDELKKKFPGQEA